MMGRLSSVLANEYKETKHCASTMITWKYI